MKRKPQAAILPLLSTLVLLTLLAVLNAPASAGPVQPPAGGLAARGLAARGLGASDLEPAGESAIPPLEGGAPAAPVPFTRPLQAGQPGTSFTSGPNNPVINVWYGSNQTFGVNGDPNKWVNILGNVSGTFTIANLNYTLNGGPATTLKRGADNQRLAESGDFNIEIDYTKLQPGNNTIVITATDTNAELSQATVIVNYQAHAPWTPGTYTYNWGSAGKIGDIAQVVDGRWTLDNNVVRPVVFDYDRAIAIGDLSWKDYTVTVPITVYGIDQSGFFAPSNGPAVGLMVRWPGYYDDPNNPGSPYTGWRRLGALAWYRWTKPDPNQPTILSGYQLLGNGGQKLAEDTRNLVTGTTYIFKVQVQSQADPTKPATYRFKVWPSGQPEPGAWDFEPKGKVGEPRSGGVMLLAHHVDATFGTVTVSLGAVASQPKLTLTTVGTGSGQISAAPNKTTFRFGEDVTLTATPANGSTFQGWKGDLTGTTNPVKLTMFQDQKISAVFVDPNAQTPVSDDFSGCVIDAGVWELINPLGDATLTLNGTQAQLSIPNGTTHDAWTTGITAPHLVQFLDDKDFEIETKIDSAQTLKTQFQGLIVKEDDTKFVRYNIQQDGTGYRLMAYTISGGAATKRVDIALSGPPPFYLRLNRAGASQTLTYSTNGTDWQAGGSYSFPMTVSAVGMFVGNAGNKPATSAQFDYFFNTADPIDPEDGGTARTLTVNTVGSGTAQKNPDKANYACGENVALTAVPASGWKLEGWSGALSGAELTKNLVINKSEVVTATFVQDAAYTINITLNGSGSVQKSPDKPAYILNEIVQLTAVPAEGWEFAGWSGELSGKANPVNVTMSKSLNVTAAFQEAPLRTLTVNTNGSGTVMRSPDKPDGYASGEEVTLTAAADPGWTFTGWSGAITGTQNPAKVIMTADKAVTATFKENVYALTININGNGSVNRSPNKALYYAGEVVTLTAVPANGSSFTGWSGAATGTTNPIQITMNGSKTVTASFFTEETFTLTLNKTGQGVLTATPDKLTYNFGDVVTLDAFADSGYLFVGWSGDLTGYTAPATITMTRDMVITGNFGLDKQYSLQLKSEGSGSIAASPIRPLYAAGQAVRLTAQPALNQRFVRWSGDLSGTTNPATVIMTKNMVVTAVFEPATTSYTGYLPMITQ